ncbi:unnamed protein product, partial [marine sediment metagenome]
QLKHIFLRLPVDLRDIKKIGFTFMVEAAGIGLSSHFVRSRNRRLLQLSLQSVFSIP